MLAAAADEVVDAPWGGSMGVEGAGGGNLLDASRGGMVVRRLAGMRWKVHVRMAGRVRKVVGCEEIVDCEKVDCVQLGTQSTGTGKAEQRRSVSEVGSVGRVEVEGVLSRSGTSPTSGGLQN